MHFALVLLQNTVHAILFIVQLAMLLRAILSWFIMDSNRFTDLLFTITEPFIYPVKKLFERMNWFQNSPIDISFMVSYLIISIVLIMLG